MLRPIWQKKIGFPLIFFDFMVLEFLVFQELDVRLPRVVDLVSSGLHRVCFAHLHILKLGVAVIRDLAFTVTLGEPIHKFLVILNDAEAVRAVGHFLILVVCHLALSMVRFIVSIFRSRNSALAFRIWKKKLGFP